MAPSVSVVIPTHNQRPEYLAAAVASCAAQTEAVETLVVDDGSEPPAVSASARHDRNEGISAALNTGIALMTGEWFCWLSSDDLFVPEKVEVQRRAMLDTGRWCSFHRYYTFGGAEPGVSKGPHWPNHKRQKQELGLACLINGSPVMIHRRVFDEVGLFDTSFQFGQDWEMWCRIAQKYEWLFLPEILGHRRVAGNLTERIAADSSLRAVRDEEDRRIRSMYGPK